jgi:hypothetical protein
MNIPPSGSEPPVEKHGVISDRGGGEPKEQKVPTYLHYSRWSQVAKEAAGHPLPKKRRNHLINMKLKRYARNPQVLGLRG